MMNWLLANFEVFGLRGQNWMLAFAGALVLYIVLLAILRRRQAR